MDKVQNEDVYFIDVRTPAEFKKGHIEGAENVDFMARDFAEQLKQFPPNKPIVVYCHSGRRSGLTTKTLLKLGFKNETIFDLKGGTINWEKQGFKLVK